MRPYLFAAVGIVLSTVSVAAPPDWSMHDTLKREGSILYVVCSGQGAAQDLARRDAMDHCRTTAADQANGYFKVQSLSIETDHSANFHQEVSYSKAVTGLVCNPEKEQLEETDGTFQAWIKCQYDLSKAKVVPIEETGSAQPLESGTSDGLVKDRAKASGFSPASAPATQGGLDPGEKMQLIVSSIPPCDEVLVRGQRPRSIKCDENPKTLILLPGDREIIVSASGFLPKHIQLNTDRSPASSGPVETLEVVLERN